jgi:heptosyltransferase-1
MAKKQYKKILVVKPSSLGDIVHSLPFLNSIRKCFPDAKIHWIVAGGFDDLLVGHPMLDKLWVINKDQWKRLSAAGKTIKEIRGLYRDLKGEKYDLVVDLQGLLRSGLLTAATGCKTRVGFKEAREGSRLFYTHTVEGGRDIHAVERYLRVASFLGCGDTEVSFPLPMEPYPVPFEEDYAVLVPGARWKTKKWPASKFARLAARLPIKSIIVGGKSDRQIARQIAAESRRKAISLAGKTTLKELSGIIRKARFVVTNDSGPMHLAAAHGVPVFALFGPTNPVTTGPYGRGHTVITAGVECSPCLKRRCDDLRCMEKISVDRVLEAIKNTIFRE